MGFWIRGGVGGMLHRGRSADVSKEPLHWCVYLFLVPPFQNIFGPPSGETNSDELSIGPYSTVLEMAFSDNHSRGAGSFRNDNKEGASLFQEAACLSATGLYAAPI